MSHHQHAPVPSHPRRARSPPPPPAAASTPAQEAPGSSAVVEPSSIPLLRSTAASIFVPLSNDLAAAASPSLHESPSPAAASSAAAPADRVAQLDAALAELDSHTAHVRANIRALVRRECVRILREAAADQARLAPARDPHHHHHHHPPAPRPSGVLAPADRAAMIANMDVSCVAPIPEHFPLPDFSKTREPANPHEWATKELTAAVSRALGELKGFDAHAARTKAFYQQALKREIDKVAQ